MFISLFVYDRFAEHDDYRRAADYARLSWNSKHLTRNTKPEILRRTDRSQDSPMNPRFPSLPETTAQYPGTGTVFYQTTAPPPTTQHSIYNYNLPLRQAYHVDLPSATVSKPPDSQSPKAPPQAQPMQVLHINLDQPAISQADLVAQSGGSISVKAAQPQVTMEKLPDRYHIEVKHDGQPPSHIPPPPHLLSEGVIFKPLLSELSMHTNVLQISSSQVGLLSRGGQLKILYSRG